MDEIRVACNILFIDDIHFPIVDILKKEGWRKVKRIKDLDSWQQEELKDAHIVFVDIQGVGKKLKLNDEGIGLIKGIRKLHPTKYIFAYSSESEGQITAFAPGFYQNVDEVLRKGADTYEFSHLIETYSKKCFDPSMTVDRIQEFLKKEGVHKDRNEVLEIMSDLSGKPITAKLVSKKFNLQNAAHLATVIRLFFAV